MPKKTSRRVSRSTPTATTSLGGRTTLASRFQETTATPDYSYVKNDLKRIGILAGILFGAMIVLYFILPYIVPLYAR
jgi:hypothetical protein